MPQSAHPVRRRLLACGAALVAAPMLAISPKTRAGTAPRRLAFENLHTGETLALVYAAGDRYLATALASVRQFLRDFRNGETHAIDPVLLDQLHTLAAATATRAPFQVISGYRSPATNAMLRREGHGVANASLHLKGQAIDIRLADVALEHLRDAALSLRAGGVGYYPSADSNFVHIDTGRVRHW
ncbi:MAG TPA: DUF882 domain-containing protein [Casimicrobiaceae bacterium]|nr:DUF882 domain-containing protein [Casimicrobiaceae bacterium]